MPELFGNAAADLDLRDDIIDELRNADRLRTEPTLPPPSLSAACIVFAPITASSRDTTETLREVAIHNRLWDNLCD